MSITRRAAFVVTATLASVFAFAGPAFAASSLGTTTHPSCSSSIGPCALYTDAKGDFDWWAAEGRARASSIAYGYVHVLSNGDYKIFVDDNYCDGIGLSVTIPGRAAFGTTGCGTSATETFFSGQGTFTVSWDGLSVTYNSPAVVDNGGYVEP